MSYSDDNDVTPPTPLEAPDGKSGIIWLAIGREPINSDEGTTVKIMQGSTVLRSQIFLSTGEQLKSDAVSWFNEVQHTLKNEF